MLNIRECPQCGAPLSKNLYKCEYCKAEVFITSISYLSNYDNSQIQKYIKYYKELIQNNPDDDKGYLGLGLCYLQLSMFPLSQKNLAKAMELAPENASVYYYYSLSLIAGQRIRSLSFDTVENLVMYLNTAINMEQNNGLFLFLMMLIKHDFYILNGLREPEPTYKTLFQNLNGVKIDDEELNRLKVCVKVADFEELINGLS